MKLIINNEITDYEIYENGTIYSNKTKSFLNGNINNTGYVMITLTINGKKKGYALHRLVATSFLENINNYPVVNHIDGNKQNNAVDNLEWCSYSKNRQHAYDTNLATKAYGKRNIKEINLNDGNWKKYKDTSYWVSKDGDVYNNNMHILLKKTPNKAGYIRYSLRINNKTFSKQAHVLVAETWIQEIIDNNYVVNHKDGNTQNNNIDNLEIVSKKENSLHYCYTLKKNVKPVIRIGENENYKYDSLSVAAKSMGVTPSAISYAIKDKSKCKTYYWEYV